MGAEAMAHSYMMSYKLPIGIVRLASGVVHDGDIVDKQRLEGGRGFINLLDMNDAIRGILLVAGHAINAEVWNLGGAKEYPIDHVKNKLFDNSVTLSERQASLNTDKIRSLGWIPNGDIIIESTHKNGNTVDYHLKPKVLVYGARGWVGQQLIEELEKNGEFDIVEAHKKPGSDPDSEILDEIVSHAPSHIVCTVGRTHGPGVNSIAYLEGGPDKLKENMRDNLYAPWLLASLCEKLHIHCTYIGTGCIYKYDYEHEIGGMEYKEDDVSNYSGTSYSVVKGFTDRLLRQFPNTLQCRIRLPINYKSEDRNLVAKIIKFNALVDIPNSVTVLPDILPVIVDLMMKKNSGIWNLVNPNPISFAKIGKIYKDHFNDEKNFEILEATEDLLNSRSNCALSVDKLLGEYPNIPNSEKAIKIAIGSVVKDQEL
ncbi:hypothetical protein WR25_10420 isoform C [Diploscapter pachys]|nr:hypothetical protein WR25_10420 isoform C [Diploscapter pachys]